MLAVHGLHKRFGALVALDGVDLTASPGRMVGFLGRNGSGKTTTMRSVFGLVEPDHGTVTWHGASIDDRARERFGYMPEQRGLYPKMRIADQLVYFGRLHGMARAAAETAAVSLLDELGLAERRDDRLEQLSHGNQQRIQLAATLIHEPELLVLDEPFSGLDPVGVETMVDVLRKRAAAGVSILFSSHQLDLVEGICDDVVMIEAGRTVLSGELTALRRANGDRVAEVTYAEAHLGTKTWRVPAGEQIELVLAEARQLGTVESFAVRPPSLVELFLREVGGSDVQGGPS
jgi:ABC-2 type transport system ATP-binding protein